MRIDGAAEDIFEQNADIYAGPRSMVLVSPLAEGSDRLAAQAALELGYQLHCPLPFPKDQYIRTFDEEVSPERSIREFEHLLAHAHRDGSVFELDGRLETAEQAYQAIGRVVLRASDVMICVWDGRSPKPGGTGQIAKEAIAQKIPTILIEPKPPHSAGVLRRVSETGEVDKVENLESLAETLRSVFSLASEKEVDALQEFYKEEQPSRRFAFLFRLFCKTFVWRWPLPSFKVKNFREGSSRKWQAPWESPPEPNPSVGTQLEKFRVPFDWADVLADIYADRHRSSFVATYFAGAFAVLIAYLGSYKEAWHPLFYIEVLLVTGILALVLWNRHQRWHERWIDYRLLAEGFRQMQFLFPFARTTPSFEVPAHLSEDSSGATWFNWYFRAIIREAGLIRAQVVTSYVEVCRRVLHESVESQVQYHDERQSDHNNLHRRLHWLTLGLFGATLIACFVHLTPSGDKLKLGSTICAIVFPAFGAAIEGINHQGELERISRRSRAIKSRLDSVAARVKKEDTTPSFRQLGHLAEYFSEIQILEQTDWRSVFISKEMNPT